MSKNTRMSGRTQIAKVYNTLLTHEYQKRDTLIDRTGLSNATLSSMLTKLRRKGLAEYSGSGRLLSWKAHPLDKPLYPPQEDLVHRKTKSKKGEDTPDGTDSIAQAIQGIESRLEYLKHELRDYQKLKDSIKSFMEGS